MLIAFDDSWAICSPKKSGSQSLLAMLCPRLTDGTGIDKAKFVGAPHDFTWTGTGKRILIVRHPIDRFASMYWASYGDGSFAHGRGVEGWLEQFFQQAATKTITPAFEWTTTQTEIASVFNPDVICKLEDGLPRVLDVIGIECERVCWRNQTSPRHDFAKTFGCISDEWKKRIIDFTGPDLALFYGTN